MIDFAILFLFVAYSLTMGFRARKKASEDFGQYFLAGRTVKDWQAGTSMAATQFAADTPLPVMGLTAITAGAVFASLVGIAKLVLPAPGRDPAAR